MAVKQDRLRTEVRLAPFTTLQVGGAARWFIRAETAADVEAAHGWCAEHDYSMFILGGGSNLVIADAGYHGLVLQIGLTGTRMTTDGDDTLVRVQAGEPWDHVAAEAVSRGLAGVECLSGIPGSAGGTPIQNVGAYGQEVGDVIDSVTVFDRAGGVIDTIAGGDCGFGYRMSRFKGADAGRFVVCDVTYRLRPGPPAVRYPDIEKALAQAGIASPSLADLRAAVLEIRQAKGMVLDSADGDTRSVGSFFMNPVVDAATHARIASIAGEAAPGYALAEGGVKVPAAWLIERSGFHKGYAEGAVGISTKHPLAIVNRGGATARDVVHLAVRIKRQVSDRFDVRLRPEPNFVGFSSDADVEYLQKADD